MRNFKVRDGDLALGSSRRVDLVVGEEKLIQDLTLWLMEPLGVGFTTPNFGSILHTIIGNASPQENAADVESEVNRILQLYQANQFEKIKDARDNGILYIFSKREILNAIRDVKGTPKQDTVTVTATVQTGASDRLIRLEVNARDDGAVVSSNA